MSVDHDFDPIDLPQARPSEAARERAIFAAVMKFEESQRRQGRAMPQARRLGLGTLLPRPSLRLALATGAAVLIAVPMGMETVRNWQQALGPAEVLSPSPLRPQAGKEMAVSTRTNSARQAPRNEPAGQAAGALEARRKPAPEIDTTPGRPAEQERLLAEPSPAPLPLPPISSSKPNVPQVPQSALDARVSDDADKSLAFGGTPPASIAAPSQERLVPEGGRQAAADNTPVEGRTANAQFRASAPAATARPTLATGPVQADGVFVGGVAAQERTQSVQSSVGHDKFANAPENAFKSVAQEPVSTFSIDVDTASYSYVRAALNQNVLPQPDAVRTEEMINYFPYDYAKPTSAAEPFSAAVTVMPNPWVSGHKLMRIGIQGYALPAEERPPANLVFLIDTSGSMDELNKLPLLIRSLGMLVDTLRPDDKVSIVAYAGSAGQVLAPTRAANKEKIEAALGRLQAGGSTAGGEGLRLAYQLAEANFDPKAVNRVMLATDGDFNVGITNPDELKGFVARERGKGIFLSVLGFGMGNLNDAMMQELAQNGNGVAAYVDTLNEARKVLVDQATSTLFPIAKDVKIQMEFNPAAVSDYRLIGYETRMLRTEDFNNDKVDAGEVGSGAGVTAIYDFVPAGGPRLVDDSRYRKPASPAGTDEDKTDEYGFLKIRYKLPKSDTSTLMTTPVTHAGEAETLSQAPLDARFAVAVAGFGEWLRGGKYSGSLTPDDIIALAGGAKGEDAFGYRAEFVNLVRAAKTAKALPATGP